MNQGAYAPERGYRYDGLYQAIRAWEDKSEAGFLICRVALVRLPGQPPLIVHPERAHLAADAGASTSVSSLGTSIRVRSFLTFPPCLQTALSDAASSALSRNSSSSGSAQTDSTKATTPDAESDASEKAPPSKRRRRD